MKRIAIVIAVLSGCVLTGCQERLTLEQAQALCTKKGGFLVVIHTAEVTTAGVGPDVPSPGNCIAPDKFDVPPPKPPAPTN